MLACLFDLFSDVHCFNQQTQTSDRLSHGIFIVSPATRLRDCWHSCFLCVVVVFVVFDFLPAIAWSVII